MYASIINPLQRQHYKKIGKCLAEMPAIAKIRGNVYGRVHGTLNFINRFSIFNWNNFRLNYDHYNTIHARRIDHTIYNCCPGWTKISKHSHGCTKRKKCFSFCCSKWVDVWYISGSLIKLAICKIPCKNNGKCVKPEFCTCPTGYTGRHCELDVNECETDKPCDQTCYNTEGSYYCTCRLGFILQSDRQSCKKIDTSFGNDDIGTAFEARDLENDVDTDDMDSRINNIEKVCAKNTINTIPLCIANNGKQNKK